MVDWCPVCHEKTDKVAIPGIDITWDLLTVRGYTVRLAPSEIRIMGAMMRKYPAHATAEVISYYLWPDGRDEGKGSEDNLIKVHLSHMRRKFRTHGIPLIIKCVWGEGYRLIVNETFHQNDVEATKIRILVEALDRIDRLTKTIMEGKQHTPVWRYYPNLSKVVDTVAIAKQELPKEQPQ